MTDTTTLILSCVLTGCVCMILGILIGSAGSPNRWK